MLLYCVDLTDVSGFNDNGKDMIWTWPNTSAIHPGAKYGVELVVIGLEGRKRTLGYNETLIIGKRVNLIDKSFPSFFNFHFN